MIKNRLHLAKRSQIGAPLELFLQSLLSLDFDIDMVGLYLMNCMKLLMQAAWGYLGLHYAKKTSGEEPG